MIHVKSFDVIVNDEDEKTLINIMGPAYRVCGYRSDEDHVVEFAKLFPQVKCDTIIIVNIRAEHNGKFGVTSIVFPHLNSNNDRLSYLENLPRFC